MSLFLSASIFFHFPHSLPPRGEDAPPCTPGSCGSILQHGPTISSSTVRAQLSPGLGTNLCHLLQMDLQFGYDPAHALLSQDVLLSPGYVLPGVHPSARISLVLCHLRATALAFLALIPIPCRAELPQPVWSSPVVPGTRR